MDGASPEMGPRKRAVEISLPAQPSGPRQKLMLLPFTGLSIVAYSLWALGLAWIVSLVLTIYGLLRQRPLLPVGNTTMQTSGATKVSVIVPARNEEHRVLEDSIRSILAQDYRAFEVIAIDRSEERRVGKECRSRWS